VASFFRDRLVESGRELMTVRRGRTAVNGGMGSPGESRGPL
jgi:hypothetical protein